MQAALFYGRALPSYKLRHIVGVILWRGHMVPHSMKCRQHCFMAELYPATNCDTLWYSSGTLVNWNLRLPLVVDGHVGKQVE